MRGSIGGKGFLFGDDDDSIVSNDAKSKEKASKRGKSHKGEAEVEEEVIDLEDVGGRGVW